MVTTSAAPRVVCDGLARDAFTVTRLLTVAFAGTSLGRWLDPDPRTRPGSVQAHVAAAVATTVRTGIVRLAKDGDEVVGAALWSLHSSGLPASPDVAARPVRRCSLLAETADRYCPLAMPVQRLVCLGVPPGRQGVGVGSGLLAGHHDLLDRCQVSAFVLADADGRALFGRHGYHPLVGSPVLLGGLAVWPMLRRPRAPAGSP